MGIRRGDVKIDPVLHRQSFEKKYGCTPEEMHARLAVNKPCGGCGRPGQNIIRSLVLAADLARVNPQLVANLVAMRASLGGPPELPVIATTYGPMVKIKEVAVCNACLPTAERAAAKGPDWVLVEITRGPGRAKVLGQVPAAIRARAEKSAPPGS